MQRSEITEQGVGRAFQGERNAGGGGDTAVDSRQASIRVGEWGRGLDRRDVKIANGVGRTSEQHIVSIEGGPYGCGQRWAGETRWRCKQCVEAFSYHPVGTAPGIEPAAIRRFWPLHRGGDQGSRAMPTGWYETASPHCLQRSLVSPAQRWPQPYGPPS